MLRPDRDLFSLCGLLLPICLSCPQCFSLVALVADVISPEHGPSLVARDAHGDGFRYASAHHVADSAAPKVMEELACILQRIRVALLALMIAHRLPAGPACELAHASYNAGRRPSLAEIRDGLTVTVEDKRGQQHTAAGSDLAGGTASLDHSFQFAINRDGSRFAVFGVLCP